MSKIVLMKGRRLGQVQNIETSHVSYDWYDTSLTHFADFSFDNIKNIWELQN